jgi:hypothetical protein
VKKNNILLLCLGAYMLINSCAGLERTFTKPKYNTAIVPKEFKPGTGVLLVAEMPKAYSSEIRNKSITNKMNKIYRKKYHYRYEIVSVKEISDLKSKYSDMTKYRYIVLNSLSSMERINTADVTKNQTVTFINYRFYDRVEKQYYDLSPNTSTFIKYTLPAFIETINRAVKERK